MAPTRKEFDCAAFEDPAVHLSLVPTNDQGGSSAAVTIPEQTPGSTADGQLDPNEALMQFLYRAPIGLLQLQADGVIEMINPMSARLLMPLSSNGSLDNLFDVLGAVAPQLRQMVLAFNEASGSICDAMRVETPASGDDNRPLQVLSVSLLKLDESRLMAMVNDVTSEALREQSVLNARLGEAARLDKVTRMPNRTSVREFVERAIERQGEDPSRQFSVLFMNCDRFRQINDSLGHAAGDQVLAQIARRLQTIVHPSDGEDFGRGSERMAGRLGSD